MGFPRIPAGRGEVAHRGMLFLFWVTITTCWQSFFQASIAWGFDWIGAVKLCFTGQFLRVIVGRQSPHSASAGGYNRRPALAFGLLCLELKRPQQENLFQLHSPGATAVPRQICWFRLRVFFNMAKPVMECDSFVRRSDTALWNCV